MPRADEWSHTIQPSIIKKSLEIKKKRKNQEIQEQNMRIAGFIN